MSEIDRRTFLAAIGIAGISGLKAGSTYRKAGGTPAAASNIHVGYAAITWGGKDEQAIDDIAEAGYKGIQLRASAFDTWGSKPQTLRALLQKRGLTFAVLSSGNLR